MQRKYLCLLAQPCCQSLVLIARNRAEKVVDTYTENTGSRPGAENHLFAYHIQGGPRFIERFREAESVVLGPGLSPTNELSP